MIARIRSLWRGLRNRDAVESEMTEEFRHHLELRTADLTRTGLTPEAAARQARAEFGRLEHHRIDARASRGLAHFDQLRFSALDVKLGVRMLAKYPGLSLIAVIGMASAIAIGAGAFSLIESLMGTTLPLPGGDRVVVLRNAIVGEPRNNSASLSDFETWRNELRSVQEVTALSTVRKNLVVSGADVDLVNVVRITASGFRLARTSPVRGRLILDEDERSGARVMVIAFEEWQRRFAADPEIIGRQIGLGTDQYTIVGVMPAGFRFPINDRYWIPLTFTPLERAHPDSVPLLIAARLVEGATLEGAQAELSGVGARTAAAFPVAHGHLRPSILSYPRAFFDFDGSTRTMWTANLVRFFLSLLLVAVAVNVAILVYARTAARMGEIAVRTALGASRARVVTQLFAEALVLSVTAALIGLSIAGLTLAKLQDMMQQEMITRRLGAIPFWIELGLSPAVVIYALALAVLGAVIVGVVPALKATGRSVQVNLQQLSGRGTRMQLGRAWTSLIVAQVAIAVAVLPFAVQLARDALREAPDLGTPAEELLEASLTMERDDLRDDTGSTAQSARDLFRARASEMIRQVEEDPAVAGVAISVRGNSERVEIEDSVSRGSWRTAGVSYVEPEMFALYDMPIVAGRVFGEEDLRSAEGTAIVNHVLARKAFPDGVVRGRRLRFIRESNAARDVQTGPWLDIVGVVKDYSDDETRRVYLPTRVAQLSPPISVAIRLRAQSAMTFVPQLRRIAASVDPALQVDRLIGAAERQRQQLQVPRYLAIGATLLTVSVLLLSAAGIYAMMSFTVARRRREIGIRAALGANPRRVLRSIFARASAQISTGILLGLVGTVALGRVAGKGPARDGDFVVLLLVVALMGVVGLLAAIGPARHGLAVQPTEALREE